MADRAAILAVEQELVDAIAAITDEQTRDLVASWAMAWSEVSADLVDTLETLMGDGAKVTPATVVRSIRLQQELAGIADMLDELAAAAGVRITRDLADIVSTAVTGQHDLITTLLPDDTEVELRPLPSRKLRALMTRFEGQITAATLPLAEETYDAIQRELVRGVASGSGARETAHRMVNRAEDKWNFGLTRALTISRTEMLDASRAAAEEAQNEHTDVLAGWVWLAHLGPRTCRSCIAMHGTFHQLDEPGPNDHQQGRCSRTPVVKDADGEPDLSWVPDADEFFENLDEADQVAILGRDGHDAWMAGEFERDQWTKTRSTDGWRDSQVPASPGDGGAGSGVTGPANSDPVSMSEALTVASPELQDAVDTVGAAIDAVHKVPGGIEAIRVAHMHPKMQALSEDLLGGYMHVATTQPQMMFRNPAPEDLEFVLAHELGHSVDDLVLGAGTSSREGLTRTGLAGDLDPWWTAIQATDAYKALVEMSQWDLDRDGVWVTITASDGSVFEWSPDLDYVEYLMRPHEVFARAYCQWIAQESGVRAILGPVLARVGLRPPQGFTVSSDRVASHPIQWAEADFEAVAQALRDLFEARGLLVEAEDG